MAKITDDEMNNANLSAEERAAIGDGDDTHDTDAADAAAADGGEDNGGDDDAAAGAGGDATKGQGDDQPGKAADSGKAASDSGKGADGAGGKPGAADGAAGAKAGGDGGAADAANAGDKAGDAAGVQAGSDPLFVPRIDAKPPENYEERIKTLSTREEEIEKQYSDGDIPFKEWRAEQRKIDTERNDLVRQQERFETMQAINQSSEASAWKYQQDLFFGNKDNAIYQKPAAYEALNVHVKTVAQEEAFKGKSGMDVLREADRRFREDFGLPAPSKAAATGKTITGPDGKPLKVADQQGEDRGAVPRSLAGVPAAGDAEINDEFTRLDSLDGMEFEEAIAELERTNPAAARRYELSASARR